MADSTSIHTKCRRCGGPVLKATARRYECSGRLIKYCDACYRTATDAAADRGKRIQKLQQALGVKGLFECRACRKTFPISEKAKSRFVCRKCGSKHSQKFYYSKTPEERRAYQKKCWDKMMENPATRIRYALRKRIHIFIHNVARGIVNCVSGDSFKYLGCSPEEFRSYMEAQFHDGMTWGNYGKNGWEIDHVFPVSSFDLNSEDHMKLAFHYTNMRPLWAKQNRSKSASVPVNHQPLLILK